VITPFRRGLWLTLTAETDGTLARRLEKGFDVECAKRSEPGARAILSTEFK